MTHCELRTGLASHGVASRKAQRFAGMRRNRERSRRWRKRKKEEEEEK